MYRSARSALSGGGLISKTGMAIGGLVGAAPTITTIVESADQNQMIQRGIYFTTGVNFDPAQRKLLGYSVDGPISFWLPTIGGMILGRLVGRLAEKGLRAVGIAPPATLHALMG